MIKPHTMNEETKYLDFGLLEDFCLGLLPENEAGKIQAAAEKYPAIKEHIECIEEGLKTAYQVKPSENLKLKVFQRLNAVPATAIDLKSPPLIDKYSDAAEWSTAVQSLNPTQDFGSIKVHPVFFNPKVEISVAWMHESLEEEGHDEDQFIESFLILEGSCECDLGGKIFQLRAGDFLEIPYKTHHTIKSTSPNGGYVKAILQRRKAA
jgi:hypothetical protein